MAALRRFFPTNPTTGTRTKRRKKCEGCIDMCINKPSHGY